MNGTAAASVRRVTRAEYARLPVGPPYHELIDGQLVEATPNPCRSHCRVYGFLTVARWLPESEIRGEWAPKPNLYLPGTEDVYHPDIVYVSRRRMAICREDGIHGVPDMICEILSYPTRERDRGLKRRAYEKAGVRHYWLFDPGRPVRVEELVLDEEGHYQVWAIVEAPGTWSSAIFPGWTLDLGDLQARVYLPDDPDTDEPASR